MLRSVLLSVAVLGLHLVSPTPLAQTAAPSTISYQGVLTDAAGVPVPDGSYAIVLALHQTATAGSATYAETHTATTVDGVFAVEIGAGTPTTGTWATVAFDRSYWLSTTVSGITLTPRTRLHAAPYARSLTPGARIGAPPGSSPALTADGVIETTAGGVRYPDGTTQTTASTGLTLPYSASSAASGYMIDLTGTAAATRGIQAVVTGVIGLRGESSASTGSGVAGQATSATGVSYGGFFRSASTSGQAVYAQATATTGDAYGVRATSSSETGIGVYGSVGSSFGSAYGVRGTSASSSGRGVSGEASSESGPTRGVYGESMSTGGVGVYGWARATTGTTYGVLGISASTVGVGVSGSSSYIGVQGTGGNAATATYGGWFESESPAGYGVRAEATSATGSNYGVWGRSTSTSGTGVYGTVSATSGSTEGVYGSVPSTSGIGVRGHATSASGSTYGGYFRSYSSSGTGVYGWASAETGENYGVAGVAEGTTGRGVYGRGEGTTGIGVQGRASATSGVNYGAYFESASTSGRGVVGEAEAASGTTYGGYFSSASASGMGLYAVNFAGGLAARVAGTSRFDNNMDFYDGSDRRVIIDVDEGGDAPAIKLLRGGVTVLELDADHNGDSRVITQELEITGGSDLAEAFDVAPTADTAPAPGLVVSIDPAHPGRLAVSAMPYDPLVAGVMSGAGGVEAGLIMGQRGSVADGEHAVALVGRVYVWTDAAHGAIRPGDFLTTSATPGHAMRADDAERRQGAVIGKAMTSLESGRGLVLVLVSLQ